jgi:uncharacterized membrane protein YeaQ/YmgE (transglycosylase-associated protein family)
MGIVAWVVFGALAGWVASLLAGTNERQGCITNIVIGVVGAFVGGFVIELVTGNQFSFAFNMRSFIVAVVGAIGLLALTGWGSKRRRDR